MKLFDAHSWREAVEMGWWRRPWHDDRAMEPVKPVLISYCIWHDLELEEPQEIADSYRTWLRAATRSAGERFETVGSNGKRVWVVDDGEVITIQYPYEA